MNLLECLVGLMLDMMLLSPLLTSTADLWRRHIQYERTQVLIADGERALELMGRAIRMAGYTNIENVKNPDRDEGKSGNKNRNKKKPEAETTLISIEQKSGYQQSDSFVVKHQLSDGVDFDCIGNVLTPDRTRNQLASYGFKLERQVGAPKGSKINGGSLICQSLDRQGRMQFTTLMNGVNRLLIDELPASKSVSSAGQKLFRIKLQMTDGQDIYQDVERTFSTRNL